MINLKYLALLSSVIVLNGCTGDTTTSNGGNTTPNVGPYTMSIVSERTSIFNIACTPSTNILICDKNSTGLVTIGFSYQGTPNFYVLTQNTSNINVIPTPNNYSYEDPFNGTVTTVPGNCAQMPSASFSCNFSLERTSPLAESTDVNFVITGQAGESIIYTVRYQ